MKLTSRQVMMLYKIASDSLKIKSEENIFRYGERERRKLLLEIGNQQWDELVDLHEKRLHPSEIYVYGDKETFSILDSFDRANEPLRKKGKKYIKN